MCNDIPVTSLSTVNCRVADGNVIYKTANHQGQACNLLLPTVDGNNPTIITVNRSFVESTRLLVGLNRGSFDSE